MDNVKLAAKMEQIVKLLNLANNPSATPAEAALAAERAQAIAFRYNLELAEVTRQHKGEQVAEGFVRVECDLGSAHTWKTQLFWAVCSCNFGRGVVWTGTRNAFIIAEPHNVEVIKHLYAYLSATIMRLANEGWYANGGRPRQRNYEGEHEGTYKDRFGRGAVTVINARLWAQYTRSKQEEAGGSALVVVKDEQLERALAHYSPDSKTAREVKRRRPDSTSYLQGINAGKNIPLNPALKA